MVSTSQQCQNAINAARALIVDYRAPASEKYFDLINQYIDLTSNNLDQACLKMVLAFEAEYGNFIDPPPLYGSADGAGSTNNAQMQNAISVAIGTVAQYHSYNPLTGESSNAYATDALVELNLAMEFMQIASQLETGVYVPPPPGFGP
jgi:hypothetical protein